MTVALRGALLPGLLVIALVAHGMDFRLRGFGSYTALPADDLQRRQRGTPAWDGSGDLRALWRPTLRGWQALVDYEIGLQRGDSLAFGEVPGVSLEAAIPDDRRKLLDLSRRLQRGDRQQSWHRLDRLALRRETAAWRLTVGREALSWGGGLVFQPMDLFSPFAPTLVDRDYKIGDDLVLAERLFDDGSDLSLLALGRRDAHGPSAEASSFAAKWHAFFSGSGAELELAAARHYDEPVYALGWRQPLGGALARSDWVVSRGEDGWTLTGMVNLDRSFFVGERNGYAFAEVYYNGFGVRRLPSDPTRLPADLVERLARGELFTLQRWYAAAGAQLEWHPLWRQSATLIASLDDGSTLLQTEVAWQPDDHQQLQFGLLLPLGAAGEEYGGVPTGIGDSTLGSGKRLYLRWVYYW